ncbi:hypothetical protein [Actinoplanes derwentensis]|uniref:Uncharacterized protein n=1 Tax=Actinoplanes derwentensis TaxID=113562 RepID=A0A1H2D2F7_9ACTN|nr:hypothetical protein [Actinoplanes derwentensis]GID86831.1 hypothetical protein Ade03nite_57550 [Actinoplanes derwentensis]SDT76727.1 hypothetical protein SAMN04489716_7713 [Actinoplanes derwentensis]
MNRRDVLPSFPASEHIELDPADHEEPTWELRQPRPRRRFDRRARMILTVAAVAALLANAGAAWAYWHFNGPDRNLPVAAAADVEITLTATSDPSRALTPGDVGNLTVTVTNQHSNPVRITSILPAGGRIVADEARRDAGCTNPRVELTRKEFPVSWEVPRNTIGAFILPKALTMRASGPASCKGATFTVPVRARAVNS